MPSAGRSQPCRPSLYASPARVTFLRQCSDIQLWWQYTSNRGCCQMQRLFSCFREFFSQLRMLRLEFVGRKAYHGGNSSNILKSVFCGAVFYFAVGQLWHTNRLFRVLCASLALSLKSVVVNFGTQIGFFEFCVPAGRCLSSQSRSILAHKSAFSGFVCQAGSASGNFRRKK